MREKSIVPLTAGIHTQTDEESEICLVIFFCTGNEEWLAKLFIQKLYEDRVRRLIKIMYVNLILLYLTLLPKM